MADGSKRPAQRALDRSPSTAPPAPLGALSPLPEVLLAHLCSFLSGRDLARLGGACAALHESPVSVWPRLRVGLRWESPSPWREQEGDMEEEERERRAEALCMLARRAASGLKELRVKRTSASEAFCSAVRAGGRPMRQLTSLHVEFGGEQGPGAVGTAIQQAVVEMLAAGQLPMLHELHLSTFGRKSVLPVWRAVGEGACPRLEKINTSGCSSQELSGLAEALRARPEGCEELRAFCLGLFCHAGPLEEQATCEALQALLSRLSPRSLEELSLRSLSSESLQAAVVPALTSGWATLKTLELRLSRGVFEPAPSADCLLHALAQGAMPSLTCLDVFSGTCSDETWRALGEAMGSEGTCLRRIKTLKLDKVIQGRRQLAILCRAMGSGHGCPELEVMDISSNSSPGACGTALAPAFRPPHGLPRLKELLLDSMNLRDLDQLVEALQHRPHASQPMEVIKIHASRFERIAALGHAMQEGGMLAGLRQLSMTSNREEGAGGWPMQLAEALAGGTGQQLETIECKANGLSVEVANRLLQSLAIRGACPRLQSLLLPKEDDLGVMQDGQLDAYSLGTILAGKAACSSTLREMHLQRFGASNEGVRTLAACLREPQAIQLEALELRAGEPDACEAVMELLSVLRDRAGDKLQRLLVYLSECKTREARREVWRVVEHVVGIIKAGGLPAMSVVGIYSVDHPNAKLVGDNEVDRALHEMTKAQWLASW